ncbi:MAG: hypothetical protein DDT38_00264 [Firmicutes bacterium]|nr:hypothetical protein [candidate division NPL-UPA2 bacterium]
MLVSLLSFCGSKRYLHLLLKGFADLKYLATFCAHDVTPKKIIAWTRRIVTFALLLLLVPFLRENKGGSLGRVPWYLYLGGVLGVGIVYLVAISIARLGVAVTTTLIIVGQVGTALLIDELGLFGINRTPFTWLKGAGLLLLAAGAGLLLRK